MSAIFAEGFEKGYLNGEQHAVATGVLSSALDHLDDEMCKFMKLRKIAHTPGYIRLIAAAMSALGRVIPPFKRWSEVPLFWNMESDIGIVAAFVYAHEQASKGMLQLVRMIEDGLDDDEHPPASALAELDVAEQVCSSHSPRSMLHQPCVPHCFWRTHGIGAALSFPSAIPQHQRSLCTQSAQAHWRLTPDC